MTFIEKFEELKKKFDMLKSPSFPDEFAIQVNMTDSDCAGAFYAAYIGGTFALEPYDYHDNSAMITLESKVFENLISGKTAFDKALNEGNVDIIGNAEHVDMFFEYCAKSFKKPVAKKTAAKKPAAPKADTKKAEPKKSDPKSETKKTSSKTTSSKVEPKKSLTRAKKTENK